MKAKYKPRLVEADRELLYKVLPLKTPFTLNVDVSSACNFKCKFCYHSGTIAVPKQIMKLEVFKKIIDDLNGFPDPVKTVRLYKEGEPLLNKNIGKMVAYAKKSEKVKRVDFTTNAVLLDENKTIELVNAGLDRIIISIEGLTSEKYEEITGVKTQFSEIYENVKNFYKHRNNCKLYVKTTNICLNEKEEEKFFSIFGDICDEIFIERVSPFWPEFDLDEIDIDNTINTHGLKFQKCQVCPVIFSQLTINADGTIDLCVADWQRKCLIGDIDTSLYEMWHSEELNRIRLKHLCYEREKISICKNCKFPDCTTFDNIDQYAKEIMDRFKKFYKYDAG